MTFGQLGRIIRVALVYATFGAGIAATTHCLVPVARLLRIGPRQPDVLTQLCLHRVARLVRWLVTALGVVELELSGTAGLAQPGPRLVVANHPTSLDATLLIAVMSQVDNIAEVSWAESPIIGRAIALAGHLRNDNPRQVIEEGTRRLWAGRRMLIFPEGTRSPAGALHPFQRGAARIALASGCDFVPVVIRCQPPVGLKGKAWYDIPEVTPRMSITVGEAIAPASFLDGGESPGVAARKITKGLREYFLRELEYADGRHD